MEFLREKAHLRFRTNTFSAVFRIRHAMTYAVHDFFTNAGLNIHTPSSPSTPRAGEMFQRPPSTLSLHLTEEGEGLQQDSLAKRPT